MPGLIAISLMAAQLGAASPPAMASRPAGTRMTASARATVRILSGAKVSLGGQPQLGGHKLSSASVTLEDGSRRPAKLVEFQ